MPREQERRRYGRIQLEQPLAASIGDVPVRIADVSLVGFRVLHEARFPPGDARTIRFSWEERQLGFHCHVVRSTLLQLARNVNEKTVYQSGVRIDAGIADSEALLREFITGRIVRALEEQKANAHGIPPGPEKYTWQVGKSDRFRRCELIEGRWRRTETQDFTQPKTGFTISADVDPFHVDLLCRTWELTTDEGRRLTQMLAELSIRKTEGTPTRRYVP